VKVSARIAVDGDVLADHLLEDLVDEQRGLAGAGARRDGEVARRLDRASALGWSGNRPRAHSASSSAPPSSAPRRGAASGRCDLRHIVW
jgi:hypothetical protein